MAHIKSLRTKWLAAFAEQQTVLGPQPPPHSQQPAPPVPVLLSKKRLLESAGTGVVQQQDSSLPAKKQRQAEAGDGKAGSAADAAGGRSPPQPPQQQPKPKGDANRLNGEGRLRPDAKPSSKPAAIGAEAAANPGKWEGATGGDASKANRAKEAGKGSADRGEAKQAAGERPLKKEAAAKKEMAAAGKKEAGGGERAIKEASAGERPVKEVAGAAGKAAAAAAEAAGKRPTKSQAQEEANGRPAKPAASKPAGHAARLAVAVKQEQQQEHAGSNLSSMHREGVLAAAGEQRQQQQVTSPLRPAPARGEPAIKGEVDSTSIGTPVEVLLAPAEAAQHVGDLVVAMYSGHAELWEAVRSCFGDELPSKARLVYQDSDGDWLLLQPEVPWHLFIRTVRKLIVTCPAAQAGGRAT